MCNAPAECFVPRNEAKRISTNKLQKYLFRNKADEKILAEIANGPASIYQQTRRGQSPLSLALSMNKEVVAKKLLDIYEADYNVLKENGWKKDEAVLIAFGADDIKFVEKRLANMSSDDESRLLILLKENNEKPARVIFMSSSTDEEKKVFLEIVERIHAHGTFDVDSKDANGDTLFMMAAAQGMAAVLEKLLEFGVRHDEPNGCKTTPFEQACVNNKLETVKWLHKKFHIDLLKVMIDGPALFNIAHRGRFEVFNYLISEIEKSEGEEQVQAVFNRRSEYHERNVLMEALTYGQSEFVKKCLKFETNLSLLDNSNSNILHLALASHPLDKEICSILLREEPKLVVGEDSNQWTPLHLMATNNLLDELKEIYENFPFYKNTFFKHFADTPTLEKRAEEIWCSSPGHQAFSQVVGNNYIEMAEFLLENHAEEFGCAAYISELIGIASSTEKAMPFIEMLMKLKHFDVNAADTNGDFPLINVMENRRFDLFNYLISKCKVKHLNTMKDSSKQNLLNHAIWNNPAVNVPGIPYLNCCLPRDDDDSSDDENELSKRIVVRCYTGAEGIVQELRSNSFEEKDTLWKIFENLLKLGVDVKNTDTHGATLLHAAVLKNNLEVVQELLRLKLEVDVVDGRGNTPLHFVKSVEVFKALMGDDLKPELVNRKNKDNRTPFMTFVSLFGMGEPPLELFHGFIKHKADVNASDGEGYRPIHAAFTEEWVKLLIKHGADVTAINNIGENAVHIALRTYKPLIAKFILETTDIDRFAITNDGVSYLGYLVVGNASDFKMFCEELQPIMDEQIKRFINGKTAYGGLVTHALVCSGNLKILQHPNADLHQKEADGQTCLHKAIQAEQKNLEVVKFLIEKGLDENAVTENGFTPLMFSVDYNCAEIACYLIEQETIDLNVVNAYGFAALHYAARNEQLVKVLCKLLSAGADVTICNHDNQSIFDLLNEFNKKVFRSFVKTT